MTVYLAFCLGAGLGALVATIVIVYVVMTLSHDRRWHR